MTATAPRAQSGFTVLEIMAVIMIIGILATVGFPAMTDLIRTQKIRTAAYDLFADLTYARGEAIARGRDVQMLSVGGTNWISGWTITDTGDPLATPPVPTSVLRQQGAGSSGVVFTADGGSVTFERTGRTSAGRVSFSISPVDTSAPDNQKRCVRIDPSGRAVTATGVCT